MGTPAFAVPSLEALAEIADVALVVSQPDRPSGRGMKLTPPPVKEAALRLGLEVIQPTKVKTREFRETLTAVGADVALVVAYGRILPEGVLEAPRLGCLNVHASLLPRWRGAAPIQWAVLSGDTQTGVCLMQMEAGLDTGPVLACERTPVDPDESSAELGERLSKLAGALVTRALPEFLRGALTAVPQPSDGVTYASMLDKGLGAIDWSKPAAEVHNLIRGLVPWPGAYTHLGTERVKVHRSKVLDGHGRHGGAGTVLRADGSALEVQCGEGVLALLELQADGRRRLPHAEFLSGFPMAPGVHFTSRETTNP
jgi:methionyl-tRNA formyltransferase